MHKRRKKELVAVLIPAHNEELVIGVTLEAVKRIVPETAVYVVDDGSGDNTAREARKHITNVLTIENKGKAQALNTGIRHFNLVGRYKYILFMDADTQPDAGFIEESLKPFKKKGNSKVFLVVGRVQSYGDSWVEKYRMWEYQISHFIHKQAQAFMSAILVVPGCATVYKSTVFRKLEFPTGTLTEDMDFTFLLHRNGYTDMVFEPKAVVYTQDPNNLRDFIKQISRWYTGFWQSVKKHGIPWGGQALDFEVSMLALEGLFNSFVAFLILFFIPSLILFDGVGVLKYPLILDLCIFFTPSLLWTVFKTKRFKLIFYMPHFYFLRFLSSLVFIRSFFRGYASENQDYKWTTKRYALKKLSLRR